MIIHVGPSPALIRKALRKTDWGLVAGLSAITVVLTFMVVVSLFYYTR